MRRRIWFGIVLACFTAGAAPLRIGWASRDVTPEGAVAITGLFYLRIAQGVRDPTTVTALALDTGEDSVLFLSCDVIGLNRGIVSRIKRRVKELEPEFPLSKLVCNATHTHTSGALYPVDRSAVPAELAGGDERSYMAFFAGRAAEAVVEAWRNRAPGSVAWGYGYAVTAHSRRTVFLDDLSQRPGAEKFRGTLDGHAKMLGNTADAKFSHFEAGSDPVANYLFTFTPAGELSGAVINLAAPAQCGGGDMRHISADYWHELRQALRRRYGGISILPQCAAAGDLVPRLLYYKAAQRRRARLKYGEGIDPGTARRLELTEEVCRSFDEVLAWARKDRRSDLILRHTVRLVRLPRRLVTPEEADTARKLLAELDAEPDAAAGTPEEQLRRTSLRRTLRSRLLRVIRNRETQQKTAVATTEIHAVRLGDIAFVTNTFELFMDYMHRIQGRSPFEQTFIVQLTGSDRAAAAGYLPTARAVANRGYSASVYCSDLISPEGGQRLVDESVRMLRELRTPAGRRPVPAKEGTPGKGGSTSPDYRERQVPVPKRSRSGVSRNMPPARSGRPASISRRKARRSELSAG